MPSSAFRYGAWGFVFYFSRVCILFDEISNRITTFTVQLIGRCSTAQFSFSSEILAKSWTIPDKGIWLAPHNKLRTSFYTEVFCLHRLKDGCDSKFLLELFYKETCGKYTSEYYKYSALPKKTWTIFSAWYIWKSLGCRIHVGIHSVMEYWTKISHSIQKTEETSNCTLVLIEAHVIHICQVWYRP